METKVNREKMTEVTISDKKPTVLIGEGINPTNKKVAEALTNNNMDVIKKEAIDQVRAGADILDITVTMAGIDEANMLPKVVKCVMNSVDVPLSIDSKDIDALNSALSIYKGKPIINSVTGEEKSLNTVLRIVKDYNAAVIGLTIDDDGISNNSDKRAEIAEKIVKRSNEYGIPTNDIIIDCLTLPIGVDIKNGLITLESIQKVRERLDVNMTLGISNISFGMPDTDRINNSFLPIAIYQGVTCPILNVIKSRPIVLAVDLLLGRDKVAKRYIDDYMAKNK